MINHARTLFMNLDGDLAILPEIPGDELIDPTFHKSMLPDYLARCRSILCGATPDRTMLNYRAKQLLSMLHASRYAAYATQFDSRVTYLENDDPVFYLQSTYTPQVQTQTARPTSAIYISGQTDAPDVRGVMRAQYAVVIMDTAFVRVQRLSPFQSWLTIYTYTHNLTQAIPLGDSGFNFQFSGLVGDDWQITTIARPAKSISDLAADLASVGEPILLSLFGTQNIEPWNTYRNLWLAAPETGNRMIGFLLAYLHRLEEIRVNHGSA